MQARLIDSEPQWEAFVTQFHPNNFLQSWAFGEFNRADGDEALPLGVFENDELIAAGLFILTRARRGNYYACAAGPLVQPVESQKSKAESDQGVGMRGRYRHVLERMIGFLRKRAEQDQAVFVRVRPDLLAGEEAQRLYGGLGFRPAPMHLHAEHTLLLDIRGSEEEILQQMRKNTRYYIKRAERDGVVCRISTEGSDVDILHALQAETVERQAFVPFSKRYFHTLFDAFAPDQAFMVVGEYEQAPQAAAMINAYGDMAVYHYAASSFQHPKVPTPYRVLWEAIREAKRRGCQWFNFWGVVDENDSSHPWHGLSQFKRGYGGEDRHYLHAQDYPLSWKYWPVWALESWRRRKRGL